MRRENKSSFDDMSGGHLRLGQSQRPTTNGYSKSAVMHFAASGQWMVPVECLALGLHASAVLEESTRCSVGRCFGVAGWQGGEKTGWREGRREIRPGRGQGQGPSMT